VSEQRRSAINKDKKRIVYARCDFVNQAHVTLKQITCLLRKDAIHRHVPEHLLRDLVQHLR
jgi:hypothetical protein